MKILVVEDSLADRLIIQHHLLSFGYQIELAEDGKQAIRLFEEHNPDLVLLDVRMPEMDGYQVVKMLREIQQDWRPILFLSNSVDNESFAKGINAGADDFLHKPVEKLILKAKLIAMERIVEMRNKLVNVTHELSKEINKAEQLANQDGLTGIPNRRFLNWTLEEEFRRHIRSKKPLSLIMIDIDFFKSFNDHFGHLAGDDALKLCAQKMSELLCRAGDLVARFGGEEFCVVLPITDPEGANNFAEMLRVEIENLKIKRNDLDDWEYLTISLGISTLQDKNIQTISQLLQSADKALYQAKQLGRNQVCVFK